MLFGPQRRNANTKASAAMKSAILGGPAGPDSGSTGYFKNIQAEYAPGDTGNVLGIAVDFVF